MSSNFTDEELIEVVNETLLSIDLNQASAKTIRLQIAQEKGWDLSDKKNIVRQAIEDFILKNNELGSDDEEINPENNNTDDSNFVSDNVFERNKIKKRTGLNKLALISPALQEIIGKARLPRTEVIRSLWNYIKENNLQNPEKKTEIICDDKLFAVFKCKKVKMFTMNRKLTAHIKSAQDVAGYLSEDYDDEGNEEFEKNNQDKNKQKENKDKEGKQKEKIKKVKLEEVKPTLENEKKKRKLDNLDDSESKIQSKKSKSGNVQISDALAQALGSSTFPTRPQVVKAMWDYIKLHNLQNPQDRRQILLDSKLQAAFKVKKFNMFDMNKHLNKHCFTGN